MSREEDEISLYAEFLPNLRQISIACHLPTPSSAATEVTVQGARFSITHAGQTRWLHLPRSIKGFPKPMIEQGKTALSLRFPCQLETPPARVDQQNERPIDGLWSGLDIHLGSPISCRKCKAVIVPQGTLKAWDDLPSENWAEMMDFWHCHKPDDHEKHERDHEHLTKRGYGASSRMSAKAGTAFVDLTSILASPGDILPSSLSELPTASGNHGSYHDDSERPTRQQQIITRCSNCQEQLGIITSDATSVAFFKWKISMVSWAASTIGLTEEPNIQQFASAVCSNNSLSYGLGKTLFVPMKPTQGSQAHLHVWLFSDSIFYSSTAADGLPRAATKVFYRLLTDEKEIDKLVHAVTSDTQEANWPAESIADLTEQLHTSTLLLPPNTRGFGAWHIGLLDRWWFDRDKYRPIDKRFKYEPLDKI